MDKTNSRKEMARGLGERREIKTNKQTNKEKIKQTGQGTAKKMEDARKIERRKKSENKKK